MTVALLLLMLAAVACACRHVAVRSSWHDDEVQAEVFIADLRRHRPRPVAPIRWPR